MNNAASWSGSGGPWITPELSMQKIIWRELPVDGGKRIDLAVPQPETAKLQPFYRDIAVLALPAPAEDKRIADFDKKSLANGKSDRLTKADFAAFPPAAVIARNQIIDLTGKTTWDAPAGKWLIIRFGHTTTGKNNHIAPISGRGLECDKLSKEAIGFHYSKLLGKIIEQNKAPTGPDRVLISTHVDSWEVGSQNWTPKMRAEFQTRRGYDLIPLLPIFTGRVVESGEATECLLWDLRQTVSEMIAENYVGELRRLANKDGLRLTIEAYDQIPADEITGGGQADEPMGEFWSWFFNGGRFGSAYSVTLMSSAAHIYGKNIVGAEAFTACAEEKWLGHPGNIKYLGDWAFAEGINRMIIHRYAAQPWKSGVEPGMGMGPWGLHYERTQTGWEQSKPWHDYLARCQYLQRQGLFVADVLARRPPHPRQR